MSRLISFDADGETVVYEVEETNSYVSNHEDVVTRSGQASKSLIEKSNVSLNETIERIKPATNKLLSTVRHLHETPQEIEVTFGVKLTAKAGVVIALGGVEAHYVVKITWKENSRSEE